MPIPDAVFSAMPRLSDSALRALLGLIRLSFRFDPEKRQWVKPERTFSRADIQGECNLSGQGTRNGLEDLESKDYVSIGRSGRCYQYALEIEVPKTRFTYLPTDLFEEASSLSGTDLRVVLAVLRATWGWTTDSTEAEGGEAPEHRRWAQLSTRALSELTGRSTSAVKTATQNLQGTWIQRRRPTSEAYHYRFRTDVLTTETASDEEASPSGEVAVQKRRNAGFSMGLPNDLAPDRQQSGPTHKGKKEKVSKRLTQHSANSGWAEGTSEDPAFRDGNSAVRRKKSPPEDPQRRGEADPAEKDSIDLTDFSDRKRALGQKLANVGVWARRIPELLARFSADRIEANFQLYRRRANQVKKSGAWLAAAIERGYVLPSPPESSGDASPNGEDSAEGRAESSPTTLPKPGTKVSDMRKRKLLEAGLATEADFDRFADYDAPTEKQHFFRVDKTPSPAARP